MSTPPSTPSTGPTGRSSASRWSWPCARTPRRRSCEPATPGCRTPRPPSRRRRWSRSPRSPTFACSTASRSRPTSRRHDIRGPGRRPGRPAGGVGEPQGGAPMSRLVLRGARWPGDVAVEEGRIAAVGSVAEEPGDRVLGADGAIVPPGLFNPPHPFYQWLPRGRAVGCDLFGWLTELYPVWARLSAEDVHAAAVVALAELALTGCTTAADAPPAAGVPLAGLPLTGCTPAADHHYVVPGGDDSVFDAIAAAARTVGIRVYVARGSMDLGQSKGGLPPAFLGGGVGHI